MTIQTYCVKSDIIDVMGEAAILASIDDDMDGVMSAEDEAKIDSVIERAASFINQHIRHQYTDLSALSTNVWLKWANVEIAVYYLRTRRNNPAEGSVYDNFNEVKRLLREIRWGRESIPEALPSFDYLPSVSNFTPELYRGVMPVRVRNEESTTTPPEGGRKRYTDDTPGYGF